MTPAEDVKKEAIAKIGELVGRAEAITDPSARATAVELLQAVMELHAVAIGRMLEIVNHDAVIEALTDDDLVSSVLVLHDIHPHDTETRVARAVAKLGRYFDVRGAGIALVEVDSLRVHLRYQPARAGGGAAARQIIEDALYEAAPELASIVIDGLEEKRVADFVPLSDLVAVPGI